MLNMLAADVMTSPVIKVQGDTNLEQVARTMLEDEIGSVVVVHDDGSMIGIITDSDFIGRKGRIPFSTFEAPQVLGQWLGKEGLEEIYAKARSIEAREIMTTNVHTVEEDTPAESILRLLLNQDISHVPVVREGRPVGMVARHDLLVVLLRLVHPEERLA